MKWIGQHIYDLAARFRGDVTIEGDLTVNGTYTQIDTDVTTTEQWLVTNDGTGPAAIINQKGSQDIFDVQDDGTSVFYVEDGGNVGIGTTSPGAKLDVMGSGEFIGSNVSLKLNTTSSDASLMFEQSGANKWSIRSDGGGTMSANSLVFTNANLGSEVLILDQTNGHVIIPTGNVGIGTTSPGHKLSISGGNAQISHTEPTLFFNDTTTGHDDWKIYADWDKFYIQQYVGDSSYSTRLMSDASGNIGIGTTSPDDILHILKDQGGVASALKLENKAGADNSGFDIDFQLASSGLSAKIGAIRTNSPGAGDTDMFFSTSTSGTTATEAMRITHAGNVGIGTTSPSAKLDLVNGGSFSSDVDVFNLTLNKIGGTAVTNVKGVNLNVGSNDHVAGNDITNLYGAYINNSTDGSSATVISNWYGVYVPAADADRVSNRVSAYFGDNVGIPFSATAM